VIDPATGVAHQAQIFVAVLGASNYTFAWASLTQRLPDWIEAQVRALEFFEGVPKALVCDNLKAAVARPLWFEPSLNKTFSAHLDQMRQALNTHGLDAVVSTDGDGDRP